MEVYLIRHTSPLIEKGICYGQSDIPLAGTFQEEASKVVRQIPTVNALYSSPLSRCIKLAELVKPKYKIIQDKRLMEMNFGDWEMKSWDKINEQTLNSWMKDFVNVRPLHGENFLDLNQRVNHFIDELIKRKHTNIAVVTHAGVIRSALCRAHKIPLQKAFKIPVHYGSITLLRMKVLTQLMV